MIKKANDVGDEVKSIPAAGSSLWPLMQDLDFKHQLEKDNFKQVSRRAPLAVKGCKLQASSSVKF